MTLSSLLVALKHVITPKSASPLAGQSQSMDVLKAVAQPSEALRLAMALSLMVLMPLSAFANPIIELELTGLPADQEYRRGEAKLVSFTVKNTAVVPDPADGESAPDPDDYKASDVVVRLANAPTHVSTGAVTCASDGDAVCAVDGLELPLTIPELSAGGSVVLTLPITFEFDAAGDKEIGFESVSPSASTNTATFTEKPNADLIAEVVSIPAVAGIDQNQACIGLGSTLGLETYTPGCKAFYEVTYKNVGRVQVLGAGITLIDPSWAPIQGANGGSDSNFEWTCVGASFCSGGDVQEGAIPGSVNLNPGAEIKFRVAVDYKASALMSEVGIDAAIALPDMSAVYDVNPSNNSVLDFKRDIKRIVNYSVVKEVVAAGEPLPLDGGVAEVKVGEAFDYLVTVVNEGPSDIGQSGDSSSLLLKDVFDNRLKSAGSCQDNGSGDEPCWSICNNTNADAVGDEGDVCENNTVIGRGEIDQALRLAAGTESTFTVRSKVDTPTEEGNLIENIATISCVGCDSSAFSSGHNAEFSSTLLRVKSPASAKIIVSGVSVSTEVPVGDGVPGLNHTYTVTIKNDGNVVLDNQELTVGLPWVSGADFDGFVPETVKVECRATAGACCASFAQCGVSGPTLAVPVTSSESIVRAKMDPGSEVSFTYTGQIHPRARTDDNNLLALQASTLLIQPTGVVAGSTTTALTPKYSLNVSKVLEGHSEEGASRKLDYLISIINNGPSYISGLGVLDDEIVNVSSAGNFDFQTATWTCDGPLAACSASSGIGALSQGALSLSLMPNERAAIEMNLPLSVNAESVVENKVLLVLGSDSLGSSTATSVLDLNPVIKVEKTDSKDEAHPGDKHTYSVNVLNVSSDDANNVRVSDVMPAALENVEWTCSAVSPVPGDLAEYRALGFGAHSSLNPLDQTALKSLLSPEGRHVYLIGKGTASSGQLGVVYAYSREATPGLNYGALNSNAFDVEMDGINDPSDSGSVVAGLLNPIDIAMTPNGAVIYVLSSDGKIAVFHRSTLSWDSDFGKLSFAGVANVEMSSPVGIEVTASHVYVAGVEGETGRVEVFRINESNQLPVALVGDGSGVMTQQPITALALNLSTHTLVVGHEYGSKVLSRFSITATAEGLGRIAANGELDASSLNGFVNVGDVIISPDGKGAYFHGKNSANAMNGALVHAPIAAVGFGTATLYVNPVSHSDIYNGDVVRLAISPDGEHLIGVNGDNDSIFNLRRNVTGGGLVAEPQEVFTKAEFVGLDKPSHVTISHDNRHVFVTRVGSDISLGPVALFSRSAPAPQLGFIERDAQNDRFYPNPDSVDVITSLTAPSDVASEGTDVYVLSQVNSAITHFKRRIDNLGAEDEDGKHLTYTQAWRNGQGGVAGMQRPDRILISPSGRTLFVSSLDGDSIAVFKRDTTTGALTFLQSKTRSSAIIGLLGAYGMAMDDASRTLYVAGSYESAIAVFAVNEDSDERVTYRGHVAGGQGGVTGLDGIRDLVIASGSDKKQLLGVSATAGTVVVFDIQAAAAVNQANLSFIQSLSLGANQRPMSLAVSPGRGDHIYVAAQNANAIHTLTRDLDVGSPMSGRVRRTSTVQAADAGLSKLQGPRDIAVSANGKRVYVAAEWGASLISFDRTDNSTSEAFGRLNLSEVRTQDVDSVDGINAPYAVFASSDNRNVYVAGFGSDAVASFSVGTGSFCSASGTGDINDLVTIRANGAVSYVINATIRRDAVGDLVNTARASWDVRDSQANAAWCGDGNTSGSDGAQNQWCEVSDSTALVTKAALEITKTNDQVSVTPGSDVAYKVTVFNQGPGNVRGVSSPDIPGAPQNANVTDLFGCAAAGDCSNSPFVESSIEWTCAASSSGVIDFIAAHRDGDVGVDGLNGLSSLALIPRGLGGDSELDASYLVGASVDDNALVLFKRDNQHGALTFVRKIEHTPAAPLDGARSVVVSEDGRYLFAASRRSDSITVFKLMPTSASDKSLKIEAVSALANPIYKGLDQALHLAVVPAGGSVDHVYVAGSNDHAVAAFAFDRATHVFTYIGSVINGQSDVVGLADVEYLVVSPDKQQVYAISGSQASVVRMSRDQTTGALSYLSRFTSSDPAREIRGASSAVFDATGEFLYVTAAQSNRVTVLKRDPNNDGALSFGSAITQGQDGVSGLLNPRRSLLSADGQHLYVTSQAGATIAWFAVNQDSGSLSFLGIRSNNTGGVSGLAGATGLVMDYGLDLIYVAGTLDQAVVHFKRQSDSWCPPSGTGLLDRLPVNIAAGGQITFTLKARVKSGLIGNLVNEASVNWASYGCPEDVGNGLPSTCSSAATDVDMPSNLADLSITKDDGLAELDGLGGASAIVADAGNAYVIASTDNALGMFQRQETAGNGLGLRYLGAARSGSDGVNGLAGVIDATLSRDGKHLYAVSPVDNAVSSFARTANGRLSQIDLDQNGLLGVTGLSGARALAISEQGEHVYVAGTFSNAITVFRRETTVDSSNFGKLSQVGMVQAGVGGVAGIEQPIALSLSRDGKNLYVLTAGNVLVAFQRNSNSGSANFGLLTQVGRYQNATNGIVGMDAVRSLAISDNGEHVYVLGSEFGSVVHFARNPSNGQLSLIPHSESSVVLHAPELVGAGRMRWVESKLYVASTGQDAIVTLALDGAGRASVESVIRNQDETTLPRVDGLDGVSDVFVAAGPSVAVFAAASTDSALSVFNRDASGLAYQGALFDGLGGVAPGDRVIYKIVAKNAGPSDVAQARVVDMFPAEFVQVTWACTPYAGATCPQSGEGNINAAVSLPRGSEVEFLATGTVSSKAVGRLINTATVEAIGVLDPDAKNNTATDGDTVLSPAVDLVVSVDNNTCDIADPDCEETTAVTPGGQVAYQVVVANVGLTYANNAVVSDALPAAIFDVSWTCTPTPYAGLLSEIGSVNAEVETAYRGLAVDHLGKHVYAIGKRALDGKDVVAAFERNPITGTLTHLQDSIDGEVNDYSSVLVRGIRNAVDIAITTDGRFVFVAGKDSDSISVFERNISTGYLTWKSQVQDGELGIDGIGGISALALSVDGRHLYAAGSSDNAIAVFNINVTSGLLTQASLIRQAIGGVNGLNGVSDLAFNQAGNVLFATAVNNQSIAAFRRAENNGVLSFITAMEEGGVGVEAYLQEPVAVLTFDDRVVVADASGEAVNILRFIDGETPGFVVHEVVDVLEGAATPQRPTALAYDADEKRLYVSAEEGGVIHLYSLLDTQSQRLASYDNTASAAITNVSAMAFSPTMRQLYVTGLNGGMLATMAREYGSRCPLAGNGGIGTQRVDITPNGFVTFDVGGSLFANATGNLVYSASADPRVLAHEINPIDNRDSDSDDLVPLPDLETRKTRLTAAEEVIAGLPVSYQIAVDNHGVSDALNALITDDVPVFPAVTAGLAEGSGTWGCSANLPLASSEGLAASLDERVRNLTAWVAHPAGDRWFAVSRSESALVALSLDAASGAIHHLERWTDGSMMGEVTLSGLAGASHLALSTDGRQLFVTAAASNSLLVFDVTNDGLAFQKKFTSGTSGVAGLQGATYVVASDDGRFVYTAAVPSSVNNSAIALFRRDLDTGNLSFVERIQDGLGTFQPDSNVIRGVKQLHLTADGRHLYAISTVSQSIAIFDVDTSAGVLDYRKVIRAAGEAAVPELAGLRHMVSTPGDDQLYILSDNGINRFGRSMNGELDFQLATEAPANGVSMAIDTWGSRLYHVDATGSITMFARQWSNGDLDARFVQPAVLGGQASLLMHEANREEIVLLSDSEAGGVSRWTEQAISRCLNLAGSEAEFPVPVDLGVSGSSQLSFDATVHTSARGILRNVAKAIPTLGSDPNSANDESVDEVQILVVSDLAISKEGPADAVAGEYVDYNITVTNAGPSDALGIRVRDVLDPAKFRNATWRCVGNDGSGCIDPTGQGVELDALANVMVGGSVTVTLTVQVHPAYIGPLQNAAFVIPEPESIDPTTDDHSASPVTTEVVRRPDIEVIKTNHVSSVVAGLSTTYEIMIKNLGPSDAPEVRVRDVLPSSLLEATWECSTLLGEGICPEVSGTGSINHLISVPAGETLHFALNAKVSPSALGEITNVVSAEVLADGIDPNLHNNMAIDTDVVLTQSDVSVLVTAPDAFDPESTSAMPYRVVIGNAGPSYARNVNVGLVFTHPVRLNSDLCTPVFGTQFNCVVDVVTLNELEWDFGLTQLPEAPVTLGSTVTVTTTTSELDASNNTATTSTLMRNGVDLVAAITDARIGLVPSDSTTYTITVRNIGSVTAVDASVESLVSSLLVDAAWTCRASVNASCTAAGVGNISDVVTIPVGGVVTYTLTAMLDPALDVMAHEYVDQHVDAMHVDDISTQNNKAMDRNLIFKLIFRDGFEEPSKAMRLDRKRAANDDVEGDSTAKGARSRVLRFNDITNTYLKEMVA